MKCGYARVSSTDQSLDIQVAKLQAAGCEKLWQEKRSGTTTDARVELMALLAFVREGDEVWITRIDRLARSTQDLLTIVETLTKRGVTLKATDQSIDNSSPAGRAFLSMLATFAQFETELRKERQMEGIAKAKAAGTYVNHGKQATIDADEVRRLLASGLGASEVSKRLKISRASVYRLAATEDSPESSCV